jgi:putative MATE family efflux protein
MKIATPAIAGLSSQMVVSIVDTAMVGRLENSEVILAAMGLGVLATWTLTSFFSSLATGTHVLTARRFGEGEYREAGKVLDNSLTISFVVGTIFCALLYFFSHEFISLFSKDPKVIFAASEYIKYRALGIPFFLLGVSFRGFFYGLGHTKVFMVSAFISYVFNILFDYILIFGNYGFPKMGVAGAGLAASVSMLLGVLVFVYASLQPRYLHKFKYYSRSLLNLEYYQQIIKISLPVSFQNILILFGFLIFVAITGIVGTVEQAATQVVITALFISFMPCFGFGIAAQTLMGISLGTKEPVKAYIYGKETAKHAFLFTIVVGIVFVAFPELVIRVVTPNDVVVAMATPLLRIAGLAQIAYGFGIVISSALQGAGDTLFVMYNEVITHWIIFLPLSYALAIVWHMGIVGAWTAVPFYIVTYTLVSWIRYESGAWKKIKV